MVFLGLVLEDAELGADIKLHGVLVAIQVVRGNIGDYRYMRVESPDPVELETAYLQYVVLPGFPGYLQGKTVPDIPSESHIQTSFLQQVVREQCGGGLAVAPGDRDQDGVGKPTPEFDFRDDRDTRLPQLHHQGGRIRNARTLYAQVCLQEPAGRMSAFFPVNASLYKNVFISFFYRALV